MRSWTSWLATLALLLAALAPSISMALDPGNSRWAEICTATGSKWVADDGSIADTAPVPAGAHTFEHCPYCSLHASTLAMPPASVAIVPPAQAGCPVAVADPAVPRPRPAWVSAPPRAPPLAS